MASVRVPKAPAAPPNVLAVLRDVLPLPAVRQAQQLATHPGACLEEHVVQSGSLVAAARQAQKARLTPHSGQNENQAMVGQSEVATQKMESSTAEQGAEQQALEAQPVTRAATQQAEEMSFEEAEAQAMKWWGVLQAMQKKNELEARAEARRLEDAESQAEQTKQLKEQAEARALQNEQTKELEALSGARSKAEQLKESVAG